MSRIQKAQLNEKFRIFYKAVTSISKPQKKNRNSLHFIVFKLFPELQHLPSSEDTGKPSEVVLQQRRQWQQVRVTSGGFAVKGTRKYWHLNYTNII